jgi:hypothetical protein
MRGEVFHAADDEIVNDSDVMAVTEQAIDQVTSDKASAAGDDAFHVGTIRKRPPNQTTRYRRQAGSGDIILQASPICSGKTAGIREAHLGRVNPNQKRFV